MSQQAMPAPEHRLSAVRGRLLWLHHDPFLDDPGTALAEEEDGLILMAGRKILDVGSHAALVSRLPPGTPVDHHSGKLIVPGFIDLHVHYSQVSVIGAAGHRLLDWLGQTTFPAEMAFADPAHARAVAAFFCDQLIRHGTTTALVFTTVHPHATDALFEAAMARSMRMVAGKVMMDRNAPAPLLDTARMAHDDSLALIDRWDGMGRLHYAITPRFAPTSTPEQLEAAGALRKRFPHLHVHTHLAETLDETAWVRSLFPDRAGYLDVYDHYGLVGPRSVFAHGIHLDEGEFRRLFESGAAIAHCPTSNLFLGSGIFRLAAARARNRPVQVGLGTDVGAGTSLSMLATAGEAYKVAQLAGHLLSPAEALYLATLGPARALGLEDRIGRLAPGLDADFVVLDPAATPLLAMRCQQAGSSADLLSALFTLGDDRAIAATYVAGRRMAPS